MFPGGFRNETRRKRPQPFSIYFQDYQNIRFSEPLGPTYPKMQRFHNVGHQEGLLQTPGLSTPRNDLQSPSQRNQVGCKLVPNRVLLLIFNIPKAMTELDVHTMLKSFEGYLSCYLRFPSQMNPDSNLGFVLFTSKDCAQFAERILNATSSAGIQQPFQTFKFVTTKLYECVEDWEKIFTMGDVAAAAPEFSPVISRTNEIERLPTPYLGQSERSINGPNFGHINEDSEKRVSAMLLCSRSPYLQFSTKLYVENLPILTNAIQVQLMFQELMGFRAISPFLPNPLNGTLFSYVTFVNVASAVLANLAIQKMEVPVLSATLSPPATCKFEVYFSP